MPANIRLAHSGSTATMVAALAESPLAEGTRSLEARWIFPGQLETAVARWFGRFPAKAESREDIYLLNPDLRGLSVKVREGRALQVKAYQGSPGILNVAGRASGRMEYWQKWSVPFSPFSPLSRDDRDAPGWTSVRKRRWVSRFSLADGQIVASAAELAGEAVCAAELVAVHTDSQAWWSLGFEATGPADLLRGALEATAALVFAQPLPDGLKLGMDKSSSYAEWLARISEDVDRAGDDERRQGHRAC
jgi:hypothetical protein